MDSIHVCVTILQEYRTTCLVFGYSPTVFFFVVYSSIILLICSENSTYRLFRCLGGNLVYLFDSIPVSGGDVYSLLNITSRVSAIARIK